MIIANLFSENDTVGASIQFYFKTIPKLSMNSWYIFVFAHYELQSLARSLLKSIMLSA